MYTNRAVFGFLKMVRPLNAVDVHRVPKARAGGGGRAWEGYVPLSLGGGDLGDLPHENFVIKVD